MNNPLTIIIAIGILWLLYVGWLIIRNVVAYENWNRVVDAVYAYNCNEINKHMLIRWDDEVEFISYTSVRKYDYKPYNPFHTFGLRQADFVSADIYVKIKPLLDEMERVGNEHEH